MKILAKLIHLLKRLLNFLTSRLVIVAVALVFQVILFVTIPLYFSEYIPIYSVFKVVSYVAVVWLVSKDENPNIKISWICMVFFFPLVGGIMYFLLAHRRIPDKLERYMNAHLERVDHYVDQTKVAEPKDPDNLLQSRYVTRISGYPANKSTVVEYFAVGETMFASLMDSIRQARRYLFLEFFIVKEGEMLTQLLDALQERISQGVSVYLMYDDIGTIFSLPAGYHKVFEEMGIHVCVFNPFRPHVSPVLNYRDHRKVVVVDGVIAYCGGINLADEYINKVDRFGHWKDTGVKLTGTGAWSFALMFMQQWRFGTGQALSIPQFRPELEFSEKEGYVQVYGDSPLINYDVAENVYLNAIRQAKKYIYITTPYLVIDYTIEKALCAAALSGVDVRIITPYRYDKWYVHILTRSHYPKLIANGVKIYEYSPGFIHGKMFVADDQIAMVGTSNMDFRSFYHHFECSVLLYENPVIADVKADIIATQQVSHQVEWVEVQKPPLLQRLLQIFLKLFAPVL